AERASPSRPASFQIAESELRARASVILPESENQALCRPLRRRAQFRQPDTAKARKSFQVLPELSASSQQSQCAGTSRLKPRSLSIPDRRFESPDGACLHSLGLQHRRSSSPAAAAITGFAAGVRGTGFLWKTD